MSEQFLWDKKSLVKSDAVLEIENIVADLYRRILFHNKVSLVGINQPDINFLADDLAANHSLETIKEAHNTIIKCRLDKNLTFGVFIEKCQEITKAKDNHQNTQLLTRRGKSSHKNVAQQNLSQIKEMLKNMVKPLPYNKDYREPPKSKYGYAGDGSEKMGYKELQTYLHTKRIELHNDLVSYGTLVHFSDVKDPELRALYYKAWTDGITNDEKARFHELAKNH